MIRKTLPFLASAAAVVLPSVALASAEGGHEAAGAEHHDSGMFPAVYWGLVVVVPLVTFVVALLTSNKGTVEPAHH